MYGNTAAITKMMDPCTIRNSLTLELIGAIR